MSERGRSDWGFLPHSVRIKARRKAEITLQHRRQLQCLSSKKRETDYAGFLPIAEFLQSRLHLRAHVAALFDYPKGRTSTFSSTDIGVGLVGMMIMGLENVRQIAKFALEIEPAKALGLGRFYGEDTLRRLLDGVQDQNVGQIRDVLRAIRHQERKRILGVEEDIDVDVDFSPLIARAKKREGCVYGFVGRRRGGRLRCYQTWRINVNGFPWESDIDPGNVYSDRCFDLGYETAAKVAKTEPHRRICLRADTFFYSRERLERLLWLAERRPKFRFFLMAHHTRGENHFVRRLVRKFADRVGWRKYSAKTALLDLGRVEIFEGLSVPRVILTREHLVYSRRKGRKRVKVDKYRYRVLLANPSRREEPDAVAVYRKYQERQIQEHSFCDSKQGFSKLKFPAMELRANRFWYQCVMLAQAAMWLAKKELLPAQPEGPYSKTIRETLIRVGGKNRGTANHTHAGRVHRALAEAPLGAGGP
jgi:hypothetical protein